MKSRNNERTKKKKTDKSKYVNAIVNIIKKLQSSSGSQRKMFMSKVKKQFNLDDKERWVITKLRMILFRMKVGVELLQIKSKEERKVTKPHKSMSQKETILMKAQRLKEKNDKILSGNVRTIQKSNEKTGTKSRFPKNFSEETRKPRQRLEDKQLAKLRTVQFDDDQYMTEYKRKNMFNSSKLEFMRSLNLVPTVVCL